jgi:hypothetical protein
VDWRKIWRNYNLSIVLLACFIVSWALQAWTGWVKFAAEQHQHHQGPSVCGHDGYIWEFAAATFENWQSEFLQLLCMVVLTAFLIHRGSAESKDSNDRLEAKVDALQEAIDRLTSEQRTGERGGNRRGPDGSARRADTCRR